MTASLPPVLLNVAPIAVDPQKGIRGLEKTWKSTKKVLICAVHFLPGTQCVNDRGQAIPDVHLENQQEQLISCRYSYDSPFETPKVQPIGPGTLVGLSHARSLGNVNLAGCKILSCL